MSLWGREWGRWGCARAQRVRAGNPDPKIFSNFRSLPAGPVVANSPAVLAPPIPQWVPSAARVLLNLDEFITRE